MDKKNSLIFKLLALIIIIAIALVVYFVFNDNKTGSDNLGEVNEENSEVEKILQENEGIENNFKSDEIIPVREIGVDDYIQGDINASAKIIVYSDFACPFCLLFIDTVKKIRGNFGEETVIAFRHFSLLKNFNSYPAALASECAAEQGKFWEMHDKLFDNNREEKMSTEQFKKNAEELGLNLEKFNDCLDTEKYKEKVENQIREARTFGVIGTPTIFVNGRLLAGAYPFEDFKDSAGLDRQGMKSIIEESLE